MAALRHITKLRRDGENTSVSRLPISSIKLFVLFLCRNRQSIGIGPTMKTSWRTDEATRLPKGQPARLRMVLEAIEDDRRGYCPGGKTFAGMRVPRDRYWIEHVMPQRWRDILNAPAEVHQRAVLTVCTRLGTLRCLPESSNEKCFERPVASRTMSAASVSHSSKHDVLLINRDLDRYCQDDDWTDQSIETRTQTLVERIKNIWPVPPGHKSSTVRTDSTAFHSVDLADLLSVNCFLLDKSSPQTTVRCVTARDGCFRTGASR